MKLSSSAQSAITNAALKLAGDVSHIVANDVLAGVRRALHTYANTVTGSRRAPKANRASAASTASPRGHRRAAGARVEQFVAAIRARGGDADPGGISTALGLSAQARRRLVAARP